MRRRPGLLLAVPLLMCVIVLPAACVPQDDKVMGTVNGEAITRAQWRETLLRNEGPRTLLDMLDTALVRAAVAKQRLTPSEAELKSKYEQTVARIGSEADFKRLLGLRGMTEGQFRERLRLDVALDKLARQTLKPTEADLQAYHKAHQAEFAHGEQVRARIMLFANKANADTVAATLREPGADFAGLAQAFSEDVGTKDKGGDTGFFERSQYAKAISEVAFALPVGRVSPVFVAPDGFAILKVEEKRPATTQTLAEVRGTILARWQLENLDAGRRAWLIAARNGARLTISDPYLRAQVQKMIAAHAPFEPAELLPTMPQVPR